MLPGKAQRAEKGRTGGDPRSRVETRNRIMTRSKPGDWVRVEIDDIEETDTAVLIVETFEHAARVEELNQDIVELTNLGRKQPSGFRVGAVV